ncbi:MAG: SCO family protein [Bacteroidetes bacterium]|nr:SCO family protein [Bacteroidota bacterium]
MHKSLLVFTFGFFCGLNLYSQSQEYNLSEEDRLYTKVENVKILTTRGEMLSLSQMYVREPFVLALVFTRCIGVCSPLISNFKEKISELNPKEKFKILVVSFDTADTKADLDNYAKLFNLNQNENWVFATTGQIPELIESVGFHPEWDSSRRQFEHDALLVGINGNGYIVKKLIGIRNIRAVESMIKEISNEFVISYPLPHNNSILSCFTYDPITGKKKPKFGLFLLLVPAIGTVILLVIISRQKKKKISENY